jgi:pyruvate, water dikinase
MQEKLIMFFDELSIKDVPLVGGKNASLGEMYRTITSKGVRVPNGFATTSYAYNYFLEKAGIRKKIEEALKGLNTGDVHDLDRRGTAVRKIILDAELPGDLKKAITEAYKKLSAEYKTKNVDVAVRSSATAEDLPDASFAGQQDTYLNIRGADDLVFAVKRCIASLFTNRAISYRTDKGFDHFQIALSVGVQKMARSDMGSSGVMFTIDTESGFSNVVLINSIYGLGENIVQGKVNPDEFFVFKPTKQIISRSIGQKKIKMIYSGNHKKPTKDVNVEMANQKLPSISDTQVLTLAEWGMIIEEHYKRPMDIEWALDGNENQLYIIQARPETIHSVRDYNVLEEYKLEKTGKIILKGQSVGNKIGKGKGNRIMDIKEIDKFKKGEVLITDMTDPDWEPIMKIASAIITDKGGRTCHAAIVSRELGIPCVVGTNDATKVLKTGQALTISCAEGEEGHIYEGEIPFQVIKHNLKDFKRPKTKIMMNIGSPEIAFANSFIPNDGVGLAREEFIFANTIKVHPLALINYAKITDKKVKKQIDEITVGYKDKKQFCIDKLAEGIAMIGAAFFPKPVIVRLSDFKTNEYANLIGGREYEPVESNPMIGWRGASRYYDPKYIEAFGLECKALMKVRNEMGLNNVKIMIPFCRTVAEGKEVIKVMESYGLKQGVNGLEVYVMAEIPTNIILADKFAEVFDGFSIGSNDLTQLTLGIDRDSGILHIAGVSNEKNESVKELIRQLIKVGKKTGRKVGICGQGPSDFPDFAQFLVECGIDSISLNPDTVIKTSIAIKEQEDKMQNKQT